MADLGAAQVAGDAEEVVAVAQGNAGPQGRVNWTSAISGFVMRCFTDLVGEGVKTDKGFTDVHLNKVVRDLFEFIEFIDQEMTGSQIYNYLQPVGRPPAKSNQTSQACITLCSPKSNATNQTQSSAGQKWLCVQPNTA
jgi:hypothetical protein